MKDARQKRMSTGAIQGTEAEYEAFVEKFKPKRTTDDCITPPNIYEAVAGWVAREYCVSRADMVRPFWPDGDYELFLYTPGCAVVDNPPFSILSRICKFYIEHGIQYFLFAPTLTMFSGNVDHAYILTGSKVTYENGADINTSFVTNMESDRVRIVPELYRAIEQAESQNRRERTRHLPKYSYPDAVLTAKIYTYARYGIELRIPRDECAFIRKLDAMRGEGIFGGGFLLSERAAAERAAAERAAAERAAAERADTTKWELSARELELQRKLGRKDE